MPIETVDTLPIEMAENASKSEHYSRKTSRQIRRSIIVNTIQHSTVRIKVFSQVFYVLVLFRTHKSHCILECIKINVDSGKNRT